MNGIIQNIYPAKKKNYSCIYIKNIEGKSLFQPIRNDKLGLLDIRIGDNIQNIFNRAVPSRDSKKLIYQIKVSDKKLRDREFLSKAPRSIINKEIEKNKYLRKELRLY